MWNLCCETQSAETSNGVVVVNFSATRSILVFLFFFCDRSTLHIQCRAEASIASNNWLQITSGRALYRVASRVLSARDVVCCRRHLRHDQQRNQYTFHTYLLITLHPVSRKMIHPPRQLRCWVHVSRRLTRSWADFIRKIVCKGTTISFEQSIFAMRQLESCRNWECVLSLQIIITIIVVVWWGVKLTTQSNKNWVRDLLRSQLSGPTRFSTVVCFYSSPVDDIIIALYIK